MGQKRTILLLFAMIIALMAAGCGGNQPSSTDAQDKQAGGTRQDSQSSVAFPRTITHLKGNTVIQSKPIKIATPYIGFVDYLAVLDEYPIAAQGVETIHGDWRETLQQIAEVIGREDKAASVLEEFDRKSAAYKQRLAFRSQESVMFVMYSGKEQFITWKETALRRS